MSNIDIFTMSLRNLFKRKLRTLLTILGVVIGTATIIIMVSLGIAIQTSFNESLEGMGNIRIMDVYNPNSDSGKYMVMEEGSTSKRGSEKIILDQNAIDALKKIPHVDAVTPIASTYVIGMSGKYICDFQIKGIDPSTMEAFGYTLAEGSYIDDGDKNGVVFGSQSFMDFRNPNDRNWWQNQPTESVVNVMEDKIDITYDWDYVYNKNNPNVESTSTVPSPKPIKILPKGILEPASFTADYYVFMDIKEVQKLKSDQKRFEQARSQSYGSYSGGNKKVNLAEFDSAMIKVDDIKYVEEVKTQIDAMGFYANSNFIDMLNEMNTMNSSFQGFLGILGAVSLFVAAIGISNTMIMSIYERTREIGVMKVIGASIKDIKKLFLLEAALIGLIGGVLGLLFSFAASYLLNNTGLAFLAGFTGGTMGVEGSKVSIIPPWLCIMALVFATLIGLISGYFPARRAMNLSALAAIKTE